MCVVVGDENDCLGFLRNVTRPNATNAPTTSSRRILQRNNQSFSIVFNNPTNNSPESIESSLIPRTDRRKRNNEKTVSVCVFYFPWDGVENGSSETACEHSLNDQNTSTTRVWNIRGRPRHTPSARDKNITQQRYTRDGGFIDLFDERVSFYPRNCLRRTYR